MAWFRKRQTDGPTATTAARTGGARGVAVPVVENPPEHDRVDPSDPPVLAKPPVSPWRDGFGRTAVRCAQGLLVLGLTSVVVIALVRLRLVVVPVLIALLLAAAFSPLVERLSRVVPRLLATWVALLAGIGVLTGLGWFVVSGVQDQWDELGERAAQGLEELERFITQGPLPITGQQLEQARTALFEALQGQQARSSALAGATAAIEAVAGLFLGAVVLFFLLKDGPRIWRFLLQPLSGDRLHRVQAVGERSVDVLGGYVRGTAIIALVDAVIIGTALAILGVPLALPLALLVFVGAFIPLLGATVTGALAALVALVANGPVTALIVVGVVIVVQQLEGDLLAPIVLGRAVRLHPIVILVALTAGTILAGIIGALVSVPLTAVAWAAITTWNATAQQERTGGGRDPRTDAPDRADGQAVDHDGNHDRRR